MNKTDKMKYMIILFTSLCLSLSQVDGKLEQITEDNWRDVLKGEWMLEFYAPWCPACRALQSSWDEFSGWSEDLEINIAQIDVTVSPGLSGRFMVTALPTIFHVKNGVFRQYRGARDKDSFITYIEEKKWSSVEPVSDWKSPDSVQMSLVSYFFKLSMVLRNVHTTMTEDYQLPSWASYVAFALATITLGGVLGLILVCCIDCVYPPRREMGPPATGHGQQPQKREDKKDSDVEEVDDIEDIDESDEGSQDNLSQQEEDEEDANDSQASQSQTELSDEDGGDESQEEQSLQPETTTDESRSRRRKPRKAD